MSKLTHSTKAGMEMTEIYNAVYNGVLPKGAVRVISFETTTGGATFEMHDGKHQHFYYDQLKDDGRVNINCVPGTDKCSHGLVWNVPCIACDIIQATWAVGLFEKLLAERKQELTNLYKIRESFKWEKS